ncbi:MAG: cell division protein FtsX [Gammaproteobacteria bacterium]|nr:cell division protein FtsX [Gammaproteobacteria bacterium]
MKKRRNLNKIRNLSSARKGHINIWAMRHLQALLFSLGRLSRAPLSSLMTVAVLSIALAFPTGLKLLLDNAQRLSGSLDNSANISIFLKQNLNNAKLSGITEQLKLKNSIATVQLITPEEALEEFRRNSGFAEALDTLDNNPLPAVIIITPTAAHTTPAGAEELLQELKLMPEVDIAQLDLQWVRRFQALTEIAARGVLLLSTLLALAVLLIIGNTIRLEIQNQKDEIEITKLIGGTNTFIRRPFLYSGLWYGLFGGILAWLLVSLNLWLLTEPVKKLAGLYHSNFHLTPIDLPTLMILIISSSLLGLLGSWIAVARHLHAIEPN